MLVPRPGIARTIRLRVSPALPGALALLLAASLLRRAGGTGLLCTMPGSGPSRLGQRQPSFLMFDVSARGSESYAGENVERRV